MPIYTEFLQAKRAMEVSRAETLGSTLSAISAIGDELLLDHLDWVNKNFAQNAFTHADVEGWSWLKSKVQYRTSASTKLADDVNCDDLKFAVTADIEPGALLLSDGNIPRAEQAAVMLQDPNGGYEILDFTKFFQGEFHLDVSSRKIQSQHYVGEDVEFLYRLPDNFGKILHIYVDVGSPMCAHKGPGLPIGNQYKIFENYILFPKNFGSHTVQIEYSRKPDTLTSVEDFLIIPTDCSRYCIEMLNSFIYRKRMKRQDSETSKQEAMQHLMNFAGYDSNDSADDQIYVDF